MVGSQASQRRIRAVVKVTEAAGEILIHSKRFLCAMDVISDLTCCLFRIRLARCQLPQILLRILGSKVELLCVVLLCVVVLSVLVCGVCLLCCVVLWCVLL